MQRPDEAKRRAIVDAAAELFAARPYHEVRLDDVAEAARVGKGTLYVYFKSKEDLYESLILEGFDQLMQRISARVSQEHEGAWETLSLVVRELVAWGKRFPHFFQLMRPGQQGANAPALRQKRQELAKLIEQIIRRGVRRGELDDPRPDLTAQFIPSCVRGAMRFGPADVGQEALVNHVLRVLGRGIQRRES